MVPNGWRDLYLNEFAKIIVSPVDKKSFESETPVELCNYTDVYYNDRITQSISFMKATAKKSEIEKYTLELDDVIITKDSETPGDIAVPALVAEDLNGVVCGYHLAIVRTNKKHAIGSFINYLFSMPKTRYYFFTLATGATRFGLSIRGINKAHFQLPPLPEQRKIAKILSTWDNAISTTERLIDNSKQQKKALMQQLLTGKKRLLDDSGKPFEGEWEDLYLHDVAKIIVSPVDKKIVEGEIPVELCNYTDVYYNTRITNSIEFMKATAKKSEIDKYTLQVNDVIITKDSETPGDIAVPALVSEDLGGTVCGYHLAIVRPNSQLVEGAYLNYLFSMQKTRYYFFTLATGATRFGLSIGGINKAHFTLPPLEEQQRIAAVLTNSDREIELLEQQLADLKQEKKALMQQLLTGKRRVKVDDEAVA